jgi:hypothetical protein
MYTPIDVASERTTLHESLKDAGAGDDERSMALRPSQRQPKKTSEEEAAPDGLDQIDQFFSNDPRPDHPSPDDARPDEAAVPQIPAVTMPDHSGAGWYPDATDPGVMRYWDGFHLTGQTVQVEPTEPRGDEPAESAPDTATVEFEGSSINEASWFTDPQAAGRPQTAPFVGESPAGVGHNEEGVATPPHSSGQLTPGPGVPPAVAVTSLNPDHGPPELPVSNGETWTAMRGVGGATASREEDEASAEPAPSIAESGDGGNLRAPLGKVDSREAPPSHAGADVTGNWAEKTEQAVARARAAGTPEAWQAAAQAAVVVSELARTMEAEVSALQAAEQTGKAAQEAEEAAKVAAQAAADAKQTVQRTVAAAHEAEEAAKVAAQAAADAKQTAEQTAQAAPQVAEVARVAAQVAADAKHKAEGLEAIVATARAADTPAAWSEALGLAAVAMETREELVSGA